MAKNLLQEFKLKNKKLEEELQACHGMYRNLMEEKGRENADDRRAFMLKSQIFQLERQCMLLSQALSSRGLVLKETENKLIDLLERFQQILADVCEGPSVCISRSEVTRIIQMLTKLKNSLYRQSNLETSDSLRIPSFMSRSKYCPYEVSCMEISSGKLEHINLKQVAQLELKLSALYKNLTRLCTMISVSMPHMSCSSTEQLEAPEKQLLSHPLNRILKASESCVANLSHCCDELVLISLLHPNAPWQTVKPKGRFGVFLIEDIMQSLPPSIRRRADVSSCLKAMCIAHNYILKMNDLRFNATQIELRYFQHVHKQQLQYVTSLFSGLTSAYDDCESSIIAAVCMPINSILKSWKALKNNQCDETFKELLDSIKSYEKELTALSNLQSSTGTCKTKATNGPGLLYDFKSSLDSALNKLAGSFKRELDLAEREIEETKTNNELDVVKALKQIHSSDFQHHPIQDLK